MKDNAISFRAFGQDIVVFKAGKSDLPELAEAEFLCFPEDPWLPEMFAEAIENPSCSVYIMENMQMQKIIAYSVVYHAAGEADLANFAVVPEYRRQGIGGEFLKKNLEISREQGVSRIFLEVRESNIPARTLYKGSRFDEIGRRRKYYRNPREDAIIMVKYIDTIESEKNDNVDTRN